MQNEEVEQNEDVMLLKWGVRIAQVLSYQQPLIKLLSCSFQDTLGGGYKLMQCRGDNKNKWTILIQDAGSVIYLATWKSTSEETGTKPKECGEMQQ